MSNMDTPIVQQDTSVANNAPTATVSASPAVNPLPQQDTAPSTPPTAPVPPMDTVQPTTETAPSTPSLSDATSLPSILFTRSNAYLLIWFLIIYILAYFILGMFFGTGPTVSNFQSSLSKLLDFIFLCGLLAYAVAYYYYIPADQFNSDVNNLYDETIKYLNNSFSLITTTLFLVMFYVVVYLFRIPMSSETKPIFVSIIENTAWIGLLLVTIVTFFKHVLGISLDDLFEKIHPFSKKEVPVAPAPVPVSHDEVFNISNNLYTYEDAQAVCSSFGAKMATYDQIEAAYNNGAEWCSYGWSEDQMAFFPTQKATWDKLQKSPTQKNNCGRPGVNGGYIANPYIKFGVNCYGKKPTPTDADLNRLDAKKYQISPATPSDQKLDEKVKYWKENADKLLQVSSYNNTKWSQY